MHILLPTLHVRHSAQAVALAAGNLKACLPQEFQAQTDLIDLFPGLSLEQSARLLLDQRSRLIAFPLYLWNRREVLQLCRLLRQQNPQLFLLAGGPEASADAAAVIAEGELDGVICGEGELAFTQLVIRLSRAERLDTVPGFLAAETAADSQASPALCPNLDALPSPWLQQVLPLEPGCGVLWEVARGCTFNCAFCYDAKGHKGVRPLPFARLEAELELFADKGVDQVWVLDSTFNAPPARGKQLLQLLIDRAPQIHYHLEAKADFLDQETAELLGRLSCSVQIGLQSAEEKVLKPLHRAFQPQQMSRALQLLSAAGVTYGLDLIYGLPDDSDRGFRDSLDYALLQQPNQVDIFPLAVLPGTELYQRQMEFGISADPQPPYQIRQNRGYSAVDLEKSRQLAAATDILYNRGRAVGFFLQFCDALSLSPAELLEQFSSWLATGRHADTLQETAAEHWRPADILPLQQAFFADCLRAKKREKLLPLAEDLINYHYCCAEVLLAEDCRSVPGTPSQKQLLAQTWKLCPSVRLQAFNYDLEELEEIGGERLSWQIRQLSPAPGYGIFLRQQGQPIIEALQNDFAQLLLKADGQIKTADLLGHTDRQSGLELLRFAVAQGILLAI